MKLQVEFKGLTGEIQFKEGRRSTVKYDLLKLRTEKLDKVSDASRHDKIKRRILKHILYS